MEQQAHEYPKAQQTQTYPEQRQQQQQQQQQYQRKPQPSQLPPQPPYRTPRTRIRDSLRARWGGYPLIALLLITSWLVGSNVDARNRFFVERDPSLSYPFKPDTIPNWTLAFIGAFGPVFLIVFTQVLIRRSPRGIYFDKRTKDIHLSIVVLGEVLSVTWLITNILKVYVGRLRPNFFAYCDYKGYRQAIDTNQLDAYFADTISGQPGQYSFCRDTNNDSHFSFPSGHASITFCGMTFLTLFLLHVTGRINFTHHAVGKVIRFFIVLIPLFSGSLVAATRVIDYRHNVDDTVWGALIGMLGAFLAFHANYAYKRPKSPGIPVMLGDIQSDLFSPTDPKCHPVQPEGEIFQEANITPRSPFLLNRVDHAV